MLRYRESEEELRNVTLSVKKSWVESNAQAHDPKESVQEHPLEASGSSGSSTSSSSGCHPIRSSRSSGLMEQLLNEMDQVFHDILAEDVGNYYSRQLFYAPDALFDFVEIDTTLVLVHNHPIVVVIFLAPF